MMPLSEDFILWTLTTTWIPFLIILHFSPKLHPQTHSTHSQATRSTVNSNEEVILLINGSDHISFFLISNLPNTSFKEAHCAEEQDNEHEM